MGASSVSRRNTASAPPASGVALLLLAICALCLSVLPAAAQDGEGGPIRRMPGGPEWPRDFETGLRAAQSFSAAYGEVKTDSLVQRLQAIGYRVASQTGHPEILFTFHILDVPEPNAFALPGGFIFVTRGLCDLHLSDAELGQLFGHECAHVTERHFARAGRVGTALSLLQAAATYAAVILARNAGRTSYDYDLEEQGWRTSYSGSAATYYGASIFGEVFRELLVRGYGRGLEVEADEIGRRYAGRAGYPASAQAGLMESLHEKIFESEEYGYWRTHPYFSDRVAKARTAPDAGGAPPTAEELRSYREEVAARLSALAASIDDRPPTSEGMDPARMREMPGDAEAEGAALFLHRSALAADPREGSSFQVEHRLLQARAERLRRRPASLRAYGPLIADYDTLLARVDTARAAAAELPRLRSERADLEREREERRAESLAMVNRTDVGIPMLELFLANFGDAPEAPRVRYRLARQYELADRSDDAALALAKLLRARGDSASTWADRGRGDLRRVLDSTKELTTAQAIWQRTDSDSVKSWTTRRLETQAATLDSLEVGSRFLSKFPEAPVAPTVAAKVEALAEKRYYQGRLYESLQRYQEALDLYNEVIFLAPRSRAAQESREGITRVQTLAGR